MRHLYTQKLHNTHTIKNSPIVGVDSMGLFMIQKHFFIDVSGLTEIAIEPLQTLYPRAFFHFLVEFQFAEIGEEFATHVASEVLPIGMLGHVFFLVVSSREDVVANEANMLAFLRRLLDFATALGLEILEVAVTL